MPHANLDAHFVRNAICPEGKSKVDYYDTAITGFILEVRASGGKTFHLRYRDPHGKQRQHKIGDTKSLSFDKARQAAQVLRSRVVLGESPAEERKVKRAIPTVAEFAEERYMPFVKGYKKSWDSDDSYLRNHVLPRFGSHHLDQVSQQEVVEFHHAMRAKGYALATCNRMLVLMRYMYNLAKKWKIPGADFNPTVGVPMYEANNARERYLSAEETQRLKEALETSDNTQLKYIVPLLLMTGARKRELLEARWEHFDLERRSWRIPTSKSGKARYVPLSTSVLEVLGQLPRWPGCPYVVPNPKTREPYVSVFYSWNTARKQAGLPEVRMHDLRHSMASNMVNSGRSIYEVAKVLGHTQLKTSQRYSHLSQETLIAAVDAAATATGTNWSVAAVEAG
ncbi:site-specific integrase [Stutzerimonas zhaodongensis]|uniref:Tyrosine-type recombinase/integrase n=1 Tax=Stutzerimonas zhaodongensis TaxID=1176257 RepID=A0ABX8IYC3_9GAMM|nr:site-specific integrase [Stutzerimonas zhaodongensis]QWV18488.1 tyrosine-type recombinase/integrase [Stutzerimonas zhaodongensis]